MVQDIPDDEGLVPGMTVNTMTQTGIGTDDFGQERGIGAAPADDERVVRF